MSLQNTVHGMSGCHKMNVSCNIWHCKNYSQNAWGKLRTAVAGNLATPKITFVFNAECFCNASQPYERLYTLCICIKVKCIGKGFFLRNNHSFVLFFEQTFPLRNVDF